MTDYTAYLIHVDIDDIIDKIRENRDSIYDN